MRVDIEDAIKLAAAMHQRRYAGQALHLVAEGQTEPLAVFFEGRTEAVAMRSGIPAEAVVYNSDGRARGVVRVKKPALTQAGVRVDIPPELWELKAERTIEEAAEEKRRLCVPLDRWSTNELMTQLPDEVGEHFDNLTLWQMLCYSQHVLNNCSLKDPVTYDGALQVKVVPDLLKRMIAWLEWERERGERVNPQTFTVAWALYRSGGATLEEVTPLLDAAPEAAVPTKDRIL